MHSSVKVWRKLETHDIFSVRPCDTIKMRKCEREQTTGEAESPIFDLSVYLSGSLVRRYVWISNCGHFKDESHPPLL